MASISSQGQKELGQILEGSVACDSIDRRAFMLGKALVASAQSACSPSKPSRSVDDELRKVRLLIRERRSISYLKGTLEYNSLCKQIQKLTRKRARLLKCTNIKRILDNFRGL